MKKNRILGFAFLWLFFFVSKQTLAFDDANIPECNTPICNVFEVKISIDAKNGKNETIKLSKTYKVPGDPRLHYRYYETLERKQDSCSKKVDVPYPVYKAITAVLGQIANEEGGVPAPTLTPAQNTILMFYTTIMQQTINFDCSETLLKKIYADNLDQSSRNDSEE